MKLARLGAQQLYLHMKQTMGAADGWVCFTKTGTVLRGDAASGGRGEGGRGEGGLSWLMQPGFIMAADLSAGRPVSLGRLEHILRFDEAAAVPDVVEWCGRHAAATQPPRSRHAAASQPQRAALRGGVTAA